MTRSEHLSAEPCAIEACNLGKRFRLFSGAKDRLVGGLFGRNLGAGAERWALRDVSFKVRRGEAYGIVGRNGSGKSTLLKIISGVMQPTMGSARVHGRVLSLLELGTGFNFELTGRENVYASTKLLGFPSTYADDRVEQIEAFADIGTFFDVPVKVYSSGMLVRLAFSLYLFMEPDVLVIDEALSVGDHFFQQKCLAAMQRIHAKGVTLLFVSHSLGIVKAMCDRALLLNEGRVASEGDVDEVIASYLQPQQRSMSLLSAVVAGGKSSPPSRLQRQVEAEAILRELAPAPPPPSTEGWQVLGQRFVSMTGEASSVFEMGDAAQLQVLCHAAAGTPLPTMRVDLLDRLDRLMTSRSVTIGQATRLAFGNGEAIVIIVDLRLEVFIGEYVARVVVEGPKPCPITSAPISVYNRLPFPPFFGMVGLPAVFRMEARTGAPESGLGTGAASEPTVARPA